jgi:hypothetical protein
LGLFLALPPRCSFLSLLASLQFQWLLLLPFSLLWLDSQAVVGLLLDSCHPKLLSAHDKVLLLFLLLLVLDLLKCVLVLYLSLQQIDLLLLHLSPLDEALNIASRVWVSRAEVLVKQQIEEERRLQELLIQLACLRVEREARLLLLLLIVVLDELSPLHQLREQGLHKQVVLVNRLLL